MPEPDLIELFAQPWPGDRGVDGEHQRLVAGGPGPGHEVAAQPAVARLGAHSWSASPAASLPW